MQSSTPNTSAYLFYDGSCSLCRREIMHLQQRLTEHFVLVDISDPNFSTWQGVKRDAMMEKIHVWTGDKFLVGLDATLYYWDKVGWTVAAKLLQLPLIHTLAVLAYNTWARWRYRNKNNCKVCVR